MSIFLRKIAFLQANTTNQLAMGDMVPQREEKPYLLNAFLRYFKITTNDRGPSLIEGMSTV